MKKHLYKITKAAEDSWWYRGRTYAIERGLRHVQSFPGAVLDIGAGYGAMFPFLKRFGPVTAYEIYPDCVAECRRRGYEDVLSRESELFALTHSFSLVGAFDVIEHIEDDTSFLVHLREVFTESGIFVATVPAHQFLWSFHDEANHHFRRYSKKTLRHLLETSGYEVRYLSYWNCTLFPLAVIMRRLGSAGGDALMPSRPMNSILTLLLYIESFWLLLSPLPMGLSLIVVARRSV